VWLPGTALEIGDVGHLSPNGWTTMTTLSELGLTVQLGQLGAPTDYDYSSADGVQITTGLSGSANTAIPGLSAGEAGFAATFTRAGACVLKAVQVQVQQIANLHQLEQKILELYAGKRWQPSWTYVTEVAHGGPSCVLVAQHGLASATIKFGANVPLGAGLASARGGLTLRNTEGLAGSFVTQEQSTVLWAGRYVRDPLWHSARTKSRGDVTAAGSVVAGKPSVKSIVFFTENPPPSTDA